jgi:hypothetical protein
MLLAWGRRLLLAWPQWALSSGAGEGATGATKRERVVVYGQPVDFAPLVTNRTKGERVTLGHGQLSWHCQVNFAVLPTSVMSSYHVLHGMLSLSIVLAM